MQFKQTNKQTMQTKSQTIQTNNKQTVRESANPMLLHIFLPIQLDQQSSVIGDIKIDKNHNFHESEERISLWHATFSLLIDKWSVNQIVQYSKSIVKNCIELIEGGPGVTDAAMHFLLSAMQSCTPLM